MCYFIIILEVLQSSNLLIFLESLCKVKLFEYIKTFVPQDVI